MNTEFGNTLSRAETSFWLLEKLKFCEVNEM